MAPKHDAPGNPPHRIADVARNVAAAFATQAGTIPGVRTVAAVSLGGALGLWTVLDGDVTGQARRAVYDLEGSFLRHYQDVEIDFRVLDAAECPPGHDAGLLPTGAEALFDRENAWAAAR